MGKTLMFILGGYLAGSILFARVVANWLHKPDVVEKSKDGNPGTSNAFEFGGFFCGLLTLCGDLGKGILPVQLYMRSGGDFTTLPWLAALVLAAPVIGHAFPIFFHFQGGKGIAVSFGSLLGLLPIAEPVVVLAALFLLFSLVLRISPNFYRTLITYIVALPCFFYLRCATGIMIGFVLIAATVCLRLHMSKEKREEMRVKLLWMH